MPPPPAPPKSLSATAHALITAALSTSKSKSSYIDTRKKLSNAGTATEHATSSSIDDRATAPVLDDDNLGVLLEDSDLQKIVAMLMWLSQGFYPKYETHVIQLAVLNAVIKCSDAVTGGTLGLLHTASVAKLAQVIDIMLLHKNGAAKDPNETLAFMRSCSAVRDSQIYPRNATERVELDANEVSACYQRFGRNLIKHKLLPHQKKDKKYWLRNKFEGDTHLSSFQRSFVDNMLRKALGEKKVAFLIWQHGLPRLADLSSSARPTRFIGRHTFHTALDIDMLQSCLADCVGWFTSLANHIVIHQSQEGFNLQLAASSRDPQEKQRQQMRREALQKAKDALRVGATLAKQRDKGKRTYHDMDDAEQKTLENYDTGRTKTTKLDFSNPRMQAFRCKLLSND